MFQTEDRRLILGAGMTGLACAWASGIPVCEAELFPGGICSSYYVRPGESERLHAQPDGKDAYRFEIGGGHWIFGGDPAILHFIKSLSPVKSYARRSSVYFSETELYVPYPLQNHMSHLDKETAATALSEMASSPKGTPKTMADWIEQSFGKTLTGLFFARFHELYTAGLWKRVAPQDDYKSPVELSLAIRGAFDKTPPAGYNVTFVYPEEGLNTLAQRMSKRLEIRNGKRIVEINVKRKEISFADGSGAQYEMLVSTLPLNRVIEMTSLHVDQEPDPYTSVLVLNIGATRGPKCPDEHWLYVPDSQAGFHRVGFYSNVDVSFLPESSRWPNNRTSIYVERAYPGGQKPSENDIKVYTDAATDELKKWGFVQDIEVADATWIDVAYTWSWPGSQWRSEALKMLSEHNIFQVGRYGRWVFQGIADSLRDGFFVGAAFKR
jgi:protoporphyrinogen oxidase